MKNIGFAFFIIGMLAVFCSVNLPGTTHYGEETYNIGALNDRSNYVVISCFIALIGAIWMGFSVINETLALTKVPITPKAMEELINNDYSAITHK